MYLQFYLVTAEIRTNNLIETMSYCKVRALKHFISAMLEEWPLQWDELKQDSAQ